MATDFTDLGLDPDDIRIDLQALGIDDSVYSDDELESLSLVSSLVLLQAISDKSTSVEEYLAAYQIEVDITSGMQATLNDLRTYVSADDADLQDVIDFLQADQPYMDIDDASLVELDLTYEGTTYETLQDLMDGVDDADHEILDAYIEARQSEGYTIRIVNSSGISLGTYFSSDTIPDTYLDGFAEGDYNVQLSLIPYDVVFSADNLRDYLLGYGLQKAGYVGDDVYISIRAFADTSLNSTSVSAYLEAVQLYFGKLTFDYDTDAGTLSLDMSGSAGMRQMGIDMGEYFDGNGSPGFVFSPFGDDTEDDLLSIVYKYVNDGIGTDWDDEMDKDITGDNYIESDDIDTLLQSAATAIESQSTDAEVALLSVNSGISEWGELNDVWDLVHEYVHDSLKKAADNTV